MFKVIVALVVAIGLYFVWTYFFPYTASKNYEITVVLEIDGKTEEHSVVQSYTISKPVFLSAIGLRNRVYHEVRGEALEIVVPGAPNLIMLMRLRPKNNQPEYFHFFRRACELEYSNYPNNSLDEDIRLYRSFDGECDVSDDLIPAFATFSDLRDWRTFKYVDPLDLANTYRAGARLVAVEMALTNEPVTHSFKEKYKAVAEAREKTYHLIRPTKDLGNLKKYNEEILTISSKHFIRE